MSDGCDSLTVRVAVLAAMRVAGLAAVLVLAVACNGETTDEDKTDPSDAAASPDGSSDLVGSDDPASPSPTPTPTPTETPTGPDDEGWAEHLSLTEEELEERRASDDFLEFAEARRAREHPRFDSTHGNIGLRPAPGDGLDVEEGQGVNPLNPKAVVNDFLLPFRDTLLAEGLQPVPAGEVAGSDGGYVSRAHRKETSERQVFVAVAFYKGESGGERGRVAMASAEVEIVDASRNRVALNVVEFDPEVTDAAVGDDWSETWDREIVGNHTDPWYHKHN